MSDFTKRVIAALCLSACFAGLGMESLSPSFGGEMVRPLRPRCEVKRICPVESVPAAVLSPLGSYGRKMAASVVAQDWFEKAKAKLLKRGEAHTNVVDVLVAKAATAVDERGVSDFCAGGGVAANPALRAEYQRKMERRGVRVTVPPLDVCGDNAAMIGLVACTKLRQQAFADLTLDANPNLPL